VMPWSCNSFIDEPIGLGGDTRPAPPVRRGVLPFPATPGAAHSPFVRTVLPARGRLVPAGDIPPKTQQRLIRDHERSRLALKQRGKIASHRSGIWIMGAERLLVDRQRPRKERPRPRSSRSLRSRGLDPPSTHPVHLGGDREFADSPLEEAVMSELVSEAKFPASWENTGNFASAGHPKACAGRKSSSSYSGLEGIPYTSEQGIYLRLTGN
jgi:hypothetical protein